MADHDVETLCDELFSDAIAAAGRHDAPGVRRALSEGLIERQGILDGALRGTDAGALRKACSARLRKVALLLARYEGEVQPQDQHAFELYVSSAYALIANWVLGGCKGSPESFEQHLASLDERLLGVD